MCACVHTTVLYNHCHTGTDGERLSVTYVLPYCNTHYDNTPGHKGNSGGVSIASAINTVVRALSSYLVCVSHWIEYRNMQCHYMVGSSPPPPPPSPHQQKPLTNFGRITLAPDTITFHKTCQAAIMPEGH